ncbi:Gfo/Idh/MocA family protein [Paenibacillaceae bacterium WGS1546]|uniref:Gfo/Idh/MocA family protein n=1 Tax=Cohnella sp. WGS1546 TaxID=3366810 RepID=UPI00372D13FA
MEHRGGGEASRRQLRVGVIGCGKVAQIMHLPFLRELPQFELAAISDVSPQLLRSIGERYHVQHRYTDYRELVARSDLDIVAVLTMDHPEPVLAALEAGKHVLVEKPLCFDPADGRRMVETARRCGLHLMVGYMKRYDPGFEHGAARIRALDDVRLLRIHDFAGNFRVGDDMYTLDSANDAPPELLKQGQLRLESSLKAALGPGFEDLAELYRAFLMLCSHDLAVLRELLGAPQGVLYSDAPFSNGLITMLAYEGDRRCLLEMGMWAGYAWWDEQVTAYGRDGIVTIDFKNPYVQFVPTTVTELASENGVPVKKEATPSYEEAFRREWLHFYDVIVNGAELRTPGDEGLADVELAVEIVKAARRETRR